MKFTAYIVLLILSQLVYSQTNTRPKLVIGIVVDQMRAEYLYRFQDNFTENGFKKLLREGFNAKNMHYNYVPTATGPGHASIYTGTTPANHGIVANDWFNKINAKKRYCAEDEDAFLIGDSNPTEKRRNKYARSPKNLLASTITDELKLFTNGRSKVIGISLKDRGAIFPAGHLADYAFWYHEGSGKFITSSYYSDSLPDWAIEFNNKKIADSLLNLTWNMIKPIHEFSNSMADNAPMEKVFEGKKEATFPYNLKSLRHKNGNFAMIPQIPFGNTLLTQFAKTVIQEEGLGQKNETDFLAISYSSTDYVGHGFGIRSKELEDTYVRMDREISQLLSFLDVEIGKGNYLLFLTADHAAGDHPDFLKNSRLQGAYFDVEHMKQQLNTKLSELLGDENYITYMDKTQIYLNPGKASKKEVLQASISILSQFEGIQEIYVPSIHANRNLPIDPIFRKSYNRYNSGDILLHFESGWMPKRKVGTTHGAFYNNDKHVPCLWFGWHITPGETVKKTTIDQIAPTLSFLLDIPLPSLSNSNPITDIFTE